MKRAVSFFFGFLAGSILFGAGAACAAGIYAERSAQRIFVDGREVNVESYLIDGHNYLQLREIGKAVDFNVYWDDKTRTVQIERDQPYSGTGPELVPAPFNPSALTGAFTREACDALHDSMATLLDSDPVYMSEETRQAMLEAEAAVACWPVFDLKACGNHMYSFCPKYPDPYRDAANYCRPFINELLSTDEREKVRQLAFFVCDRIEYDSLAYCSPRTALISDTVQKGACMSYAHCFKFLCDMAKIPCIFTHSDEHQWNQVYLEGKWWHVDVTSVDASDVSLRPLLPILKEESEMQGSMYVQSQPSLTIIAKELMVPGSTLN